MKHEQPITLSKERRNTMISEIKNYYATERDEVIGELAAGMLLDFFMDRLAPEIYNQGVYDSHKYIAEAAEDLLSILK
ncbi:MAG TPA: DUF2164 domain-containing protein [Methanospirillum sp.]|uniref:DUF2164 domain-containing protein n=1 Tax=Methanospirillum sp. TaxID=45200 RepID=UPI002BF3F45B|nr:DUF2164 domain-containing protein [Methanospirillum sp.]HWQ64480.1 DUF2164 domain-containing protein [Methanospirillum sp.]